MVLLENSNNSNGVVFNGTVLGMLPAAIVQQLQVLEH
jgi:hypothetical protein